MIQEKDSIKQLYAGFGRTFVLLFNRCFMYSPTHPFQIEAINSAFNAARELLLNISPVVFILNREQFYVDEESLDSRLNVSRMVFHFKKAGMESISFYKGVEKKELHYLLEIVSSLNQYPNVEAMKKAMFKKRVEHIKINHIVYKKVSTEDDVVSRVILDKVTPDMEVEYHGKLKQLFMDTVFSSVLQEDFVKNLNLKNLLDNPNNISRKMIAADLSAVKHCENVKSNISENENPDDNKNTVNSKGENAVPRPGQFLLHQLEVMEEDVERNLSKGTGVDLPQLAEALFDMRQKLAEGIEAQKALGIVYSNEEEVLSKADEITDNVLIRLIKEEYKGGEISVTRLAQILCRIIPEANALKRLLPKIRSALLGEGMSQADFMVLVKELGVELQSDGLVNILAESAEEIGLDGDDIIQQVKVNPAKSAEMIYLASEIKKKGGDEKALTDLLVDYVEQIGTKYSQNLSEKAGEDCENYLHKALAEVRSNLTQQLGDSNIKDDILKRLEDRVNKRMDVVFDKLRLEWISSHSNSSNNDLPKALTVLETLEQGVNEEEELGQILKIVRKKVESDEIDENDFDQIFPEIIKLEKLRKSESDKTGLSYGIMREEILMSLLDKEISKTKRYKTSLSVLGFTLVKTIAKKRSQQNKIFTRDIINALLLQLVDIFRTPDIIGEVGKNNLIVLLPMTDRGQATLALRRSMKILHLKPLIIKGAAYEIKVAGVVADINFDEIKNAKLLTDRLRSQLKDMAVRINNLHANSW